MNIILVGPQGSGKGTQAELMVARYGMKHFSTGDALRAEKSSGSTLGKKIAKLMDAGHMVPDEIVDAIIVGALEDFRKQGILFDGFPRSVVQAEFLSKHTKIDALVEIHISDDEAVKRISSRFSCPKCGAVFNMLTKRPKKKGVCNADGTALVQRADDHEDQVRLRLADYHKKTEPLHSFYKKMGVPVHIIDGEKPIDVVFRDIAKNLG
jgi:adenylate kinase